MNKTILALSIALLSTSALAKRPTNEPTPEPVATPSFVGAAIVDEDGVDIGNIVNFSSNGGSSFDHIIYKDGAFISNVISGANKFSDSNCTVNVEQANNVEHVIFGINVGDIVTGIDADGQAWAIPQGSQPQEQGFYMTDVRGMCYAYGTQVSYELTPHQGDLSMMVPAKYDQGFAFNGVFIK